MVDNENNEHSSVPPITADDLQNLESSLPVPWSQGSSLLHSLWGAESDESAQQSSKSSESDESARRYEATPSWSVN